jgi:predicted negative regulator of RcsB-dependent stress response
MKRVRGVVVLLLVVLVGLGFYRGWFHLSTSGTGDKASATITMDKGKIRADEKKAKAEMPDFGQKAKEKTADGTGTVKDPESRP